MTDRRAAIQVDDLRKAYGDVEAVRGHRLRASRRGEVFGLLGPNGAGKTTTVEILEGYRERTGGIVSVLGIDPGGRAARAARARRHRAADQRDVPPPDRPRGASPLGAALPAPARRRRGRSSSPGSEAGGGAAHAHALGRPAAPAGLRARAVGDPELVFLDEPTTGFDPAARRAAWETVRSLRDLGKTVLLTTHYLDEAQALADRVAIIKDGAILAEGAPARARRRRARATASPGATRDGEPRTSARPTTRPRCCTS